MVLALSACSSPNVADKKLDYQRTVSPPSLDVPPDLIEPEYDPLAPVPAGGAARQGPTLLPLSEHVRMVRAGDVRWLEVDMPPEELWQKLLKFWQVFGIELLRADKSVGIMETVWAENKADVPKGPISSLIMKITPKAYSADTRDRFRIRLERTDQAERTELYLTHYGLEEVVREEYGSLDDRAVWQTRPSNPELVNEVLVRILLHLGADEQQSRTMITDSEAEEAQQESRTRLVEDGEVPYIDLQERFVRTWRRAGVILDRLSLVVEDRDRSAGIYYVKDVDLLKDAGVVEKGFGSLFSSSEDEPGQFRVVLDRAGDTTHLLVEDIDGKALPAEAALLILKRIQQELK